jgi:thiamine phosphate synthase YjbQ (UPF0047 family)
MHRLTIPTHRKREILDITDEVSALLPAATGVACLNILHTTAALTTADLDPGTDLDMLDAFEAMMPKLRYRHPHNPEHVPDHILSSLIGTGLTPPSKPAPSTSAHGNASSSSSWTVPAHAS